MGVSPLMLQYRAISAPHTIIGCIYAIVFDVHVLAFYALC